jgi:N-acetylmuramoyl-L-alanine amidase
VSRRLRHVLVPLAAALALGASVAPPPGNVIRVKGVGGDTVIALVPSAGGGLVRLDLMARLLGGTLDSVAAGTWRFTLYGSALEMREGTPFLGYNGFVLPLHEPVQVVDGAVHAPLQLFSEIVPRFGIGILWDRSRWEVRLFQGIARRPTPIGRESTVPTTPVAAASNGGAPAAAPVTPPPAPTPTNGTAPATATVPASASPAPPAPARAAGPGGLSRRYTIAVDAGHGGRDHGNAGVILNGRRVDESVLTLAMARRVESELRSRGLDVVMIRSSDTLVARDDRGPIANAKRADLFISIHTNAFNPAWRNGSSVRGVETYFLATARTEDERRVAEMENDVVRFETDADVEKGDPLSFILNDLAQNEHLRESADLAALVQERLAAKHPGPNRGVKQAGFAVLARAFMPAILVEVGFGTNAEDARWMASVAGQREIATAITEAVFEYLQHYERRTRAAAR